MVQIKIHIFAYLFMLAPAQDVVVEPSLHEYSVGNVINCSASGWPAPAITWRHVGGPASPGANEGHQLTVTEEMRGARSTWKCMAVNIYGTDELIVTFNVSCEF